MKATDHLDGLATSLTAGGWSIRRRYEEAPARLRVCSPDRPCPAESVSVKAGTGGVPWFMSSTGDPLRPCHDIVGAVAEIEALLRPFATPTPVTEPPRRRRLVDKIRELVRKPD